MRVAHAFTIHGICPVDGSADEYKTTILVDRVLKVEDILAEVEKQTTKPIFQEHLTKSLALMLGARVETIGYHSGVETVCTVDGLPRPSFDGEAS